jgi:hypothetical protein
MKVQIKGNDVVFGSCGNKTACWIKAEVTDQIEEGNAAN